MDPDGVDKPAGAPPEADDAGTEKVAAAAAAVLLPYGPYVLPVLVRNASEVTTASGTLPKRPTVPATAVTCSPADSSICTYIALQD